MIGGQAPQFIILSIEIVFFGILFALFSSRIFDTELRERFAKQLDFEILLSYVCLVLILGRIMVFSLLLSLDRSMRYFYDSMIFAILSTQISIYLWVFSKTLPHGGYRSSFFHRLHNIIPF